MSSGDYIDIGVLLIVLLLGLRGLSNGLIHEVMGVIGVVLGIFLASRYCSEGAEYLRLAGLEFENKSVLISLAFLVILSCVWIGFLVIGAILARFVIVVPEITIINVYGGFVFAALKYFVILSVLTYGLSQVEFLKKPLQDFTEETRSYPIMYDIAEKIINTDALQKLKKTYEEKTQDLKNTATEAVSKAINEKKAEIKEDLKNVAAEVKEKVADEKVIENIKAGK